MGLALFGMGGLGLVGISDIFFGIVLFMLGYNLMRLLVFF